VTGCLTFTGNHFAQILEGREDAIDELRRRISIDHRHADVRVLLERGLTLREYPLWSMAFLDSLELADEIRGLIDPVPPTSRKMFQVMSRLKPDTVMGAL
jgi:hypothetical protein